MSLRRAYAVIALIVSFSLLQTQVASAVEPSGISVKAKKKKVAVRYAYSQDGVRVKCTIVGTDRKDKLVGTEGDDVICGFGGNDKIVGLGGNDIIDAGTGKDSVNGGAGDDVVVGGDGNDSLAGSEGMDEIIGGSGNDSTSGGSGDDLVEGSPGKDSLSGDDGNDELDGGLGKDVLTGGAGSNTCTKDTADRGVTGCYFDNSDPSVSEIWTEPAVVDTSTGPQTFSVFVRMSDETGGFPIHSLWGMSPVSLNISRVEINSNGDEIIKPGISSSGMATTASCAKVARWQASMPTNSIMMPTLGCRVGGGRMDPLVKFTYTLPQYSPPGVYRVTNLVVSDAARNTTNYMYKNMCSGCINNPGATTKYINEIFDSSKTSVTQAGPGDVTPPTIQSVEYATSVDTTSGDQYLTARIYASDDVGFPSSANGGAVSLSFSNHDYQNFNGPRPMNINFGGGAAGILCSQVPQMMANSMMGCQESPGVFKAMIRVPQGIQDGLYDLSYVSISDGVGNFANFHTCTGCSNLYNSISSLNTSGQISKTGFVGSSDTSAPQLISMSVDTPNVNSAGGAVSAMVRVTVRDAGGFSGNMSPVYLRFAVDGTNQFNMGGSGTGQVNMNFSTPGGPSRIMTCGEVEQQAHNSGGGFAPINQIGCLLSQSGSDYTFRVPVQLPAHARSGTYSLVSVSTSDGSNQMNYGVRGGIGMPSNSYFEDILGGRPSFINSY